MNDYNTFLREEATDFFLEIEEEERTRLCESLKQSGIYFREPGFVCKRFLGKELYVISKKEYEEFSELFSEALYAVYKQYWYTRKCVLKSSDVEVSRTWLDEYIKNTVNSALSEKCLELTKEFERVEESER